MPWVAAAGAVVGGYISSQGTQSAANTAAGAQTAASQAAIEEQRRQFDIMREILAPYTMAGGGALSSQQALLGLRGNELQQREIDALQQSPMFTELAKQGESAILQNAAATGGLRGGDVQGALAQFRPNMLNQLIQQRFSNLGSISSMGQASAAGQAQLGQQGSQVIGGLLGNIGQAQAGAALAQGQAQAQLGSSIGNAAGMYAYYNRSRL